MKFRNYCIVVMGNMEGAKDDIVQIAETKPRYIDAKGILIATFASVMGPAELQEFFTANGRSFFVFDLDGEHSGYNLDNIKLHTHLFGHLLGQEDKLKEMSEKLNEEISATTRSGKVVNTKRVKAKKKSVDKRHFTDMSKKERQEVVNTILDKGYEKITNSDRDILKKISELK